MRALLLILVVAVGVGIVQLLARSPAGSLAAVSGGSESVAAAQAASETVPMVRLQRVWGRLLAAGWPREIPAPLLAYSARAWVHSQGTGEVVFGPHLLTAADDEIAFALAHELAHFLLGHHDDLKVLPKEPVAVLRIEQWRMELEADARAYGVMQQAGFDSGGIASYLERYAPVHATGSTHPSSAARLQQLGFATDAQRVVQLR